MQFGLVFKTTALSLCLLGMAARAHGQDEPVINEPFSGEPSFEIEPLEDDRLDRMLEALGDDSFQKARPEAAPEELPDIERRVREPSAFAKAIANFFSAIAPFIGYLLLAALIVAGLLVLYYMFGESLSLHGRQKEKSQKPDISDISDLRPDAAAATALLDDADTLAANGRYAEAVHTLLFRSIAHIQEKQAASVPRSLTAREIGQLETLTPDIRSALWPIITIVERGYFGGRETTEADWLQARASYRAFAFGETAA